MCHHTLEQEAQATHTEHMCGCESKPIAHMISGKRLLRLFATHKVSGMDIHTLRLLSNQRLADSLYKVRVH